MMAHRLWSVLHQSQGWSAPREGRGGGIEYGGGGYELTDLQASSSRPCQGFFIFMLPQKKDDKTLQRNLGRLSLFTDSKL